MCLCDLEINYINNYIVHKEYKKKKAAVAVCWLFSHWFKYF